MFGSLYAEEISSWAHKRDDAWIQKKFTPKTFWQVPKTSSGDYIFRHSCICSKICKYNAIFFINENSENSMQERALDDQVLKLPCFIETLVSEVIIKTEL